MAIAFNKDIANVLARAGGVFFSDDDGTTYYDSGRIKGAMIEFDANETEEDTAGRTIALSYNVRLSFVMTQTAADETGSIDDVAAITTNGVWVKFTEVFTDATGAGAAAGLLFKNCTPVFSGKMDYNNGESGLPCVIKGRVSTAVLAAGLAAGTIVFDY